MNEAPFWIIIQQAHDASHGDMDSKCDLVEDALCDLTSAESERRRFAPHPDVPAGEAWDEDEVLTLFPRLAARFG